MSFSEWRTQQWKIGFYLSPEVVKNPLLRFLLNYKGTILSKGKKWFLSFLNFRVEMLFGAAKVGWAIPGGLLIAQDQAGEVVLELKYRLQMLVFWLMVTFYLVKFAFRVSVLVSAFLHYFVLEIELQLSLQLFLW